MKEEFLNSGTLEYAAYAPGSGKTKVYMPWSYTFLRTLFKKEKKRNTKSYVESHTQAWKQLTLSSDPESYI